MSSGIFLRQTPAVRPEQVNKVGVVISLLIEMKCREMFVMVGIWSMESMKETSMEQRWTPSEKSCGLGRCACWT